MNLDLLRHRQSRAVECDPAAGRQSVDDLDLRARSGQRRGEMGLPLNPHDMFDHDEINESILLDLDHRRQDRKVMVHIGRDGYMWVIDRATGEALSVEPYDTVNAYKGFDYKRGRLDPQSGQAADAEQDGARHLPDRARRQGLAALRLVAAHQADLCAAPASVHGLEVAEVGYIAGTPFVGATVDMYRRAGRLSRRVHGLGSGRQEEGLGDPRELPGMERHRGHRGRRRLLRHHGPLVQSGRREVRQGPVEVPCRLGDHRPAGDLPGQRRGAICRHPRRRRAAGPAPSPHAELDPRLRNGALGFVGAMQDLPAYTGGGSELLVFALPQAKKPTNPAEGSHEDRK